MYQLIIRKNIDKLIIAAFVMLLFSSDKNLLVTHYILGRENLKLMTISFISILLFFLFYLFALKGSLSIRHSHRKLLYTSVFLAIYFIAHEFIFGDGLTSAKYAIFLIILMISLMIRFNVFFVFKILGYFGGFISLCVVTQQILLLTFNGGDVSQFEVAINGDEWARWEGCDFILPYGLGLLERCTSGHDVWISGFKLNRSIFFMTEPKYLSSLLLVTLSSLLISKKNSSLKSLFLVLHLLALSFSASASAILVLLISVILVFVRLIGPMLFTSFVFLFPIFVLPTIIYSILLIAGIDGFLLNRLMSASGSIGEGGLQNFTIFGQAFGACDDILCKTVGLLDNLTETYGIVGFSIFWIFFYLAIKPMFKVIRYSKIDISKRLGLMILLNTYVVFNVYFFGDIFNMYGLLILLTIILLPDYISYQKPMVSSTKEKIYKDKFGVIS